MPAPAQNASTAVKTDAPGPQGPWLWGISPLDYGEPLDVLVRWSREYGDVVRWRMLHLRVYLLSHPDDIETVLLTESRKFVKGRILQANRETLGDGLLTSEGDLWLHQRRLIQPAFRRERVLAYAPLMISRAAQMIDHWEAGRPLDLHRELMRLTLEIAAETLFGVTVREDADRVSAALDTLMAANTSPGRLFLLMRRLPTAANRRYTRAVRELERIVYKMIAQRRADGLKTAGGSDDLLSRLLNAEDESGRRMSDRQLRDECITLLLAGHETTALALSWAAYLLAQNPDAQKQLQAEIDAVLCGRLPGVTDLPRLVHTERVVRETLRLYPPAWLMPRLAVEDCDLREFRVPKSAGVIFSQWIVHRDPRWFAQPEQFRPERWTEEFARALPRFAYFPFGGGPRVCVGSSFAMIEAVLLLAVIAQRFRLALARPEPVEPLATMTLRPKGGVWITLSRRP
jgi:cytochrome P450